MCVCGGGGTRISKYGGDMSDRKKERKKQNSYNNNNNEAIHESSARNYD